MCACSSSKMVADRYMKEGKPSLAIPEFQAILANEPTDYYAGMGLVTALVESGQPAKGLEFAEAFLKYYPQDPILLYNAGLVALTLNRNQRAVELFTRAIEQSPNWHQPIWNRGTAYDNLAQWEQALRDYDRALQLEPKNLDARNNRAKTKTSLQDFRGALEDLTIVLVASPEHPKARGNLKAACAQLRDKPSICETEGKAD